MTTYDRVDCDVLVGDQKLGNFANALRVLPDSGSECLLDFCIYSSVEGSAEVVARVRVHKSFLPLLKQRIEDAMGEMWTQDEDSWLALCSAAEG